MRVDAYASLPHYAEHLASIWQALPAEQRGTFYSPRASSSWGQPLRGRMDRTTPTLVAAYSDAVKMRPRPLILVEHGSGQSYEGDPRSAGHGSYSGGRDLADVVLFLCPNEVVAERWRRAYPAVEAAVVGCPKLDRWHCDIGRKDIRAEVTPTVAVTFHWECSLIPETRSAWPHYDEALEQLVADAADSGWKLLGHGHPRLWGRIERRWRALGVEPVRELADVLDRADVLVADNTSAMWEFASVDRPLVVLDAPWYRHDVDHGLRFWKHADAGVRIHRGALLAAAIEEALVDAPEQQARRRAASREVYDRCDGRAAERAAAAIVRRTEEQMPNPYAPRRTRTSSEVERPVDTLTRRLQTLGASADDVAAFQEAWAEGNAEAETPEDRAEFEAGVRELLHLDDTTLRRMLAAARGDDPDLLHELPIEQDSTSVVNGAVAPPERPQPADGSSSAPSGERPAEGAAGGDPETLPPVAQRAELRVRGGDSVRALLDWIEDDAEKARAVEQAERDAATEEGRPPRKTLLDGVARVVGG